MQNLIGTCTTLSYINWVWSTIEQKQLKMLEFILIFNSQVENIKIIKESKEWLALMQNQNYLVLFI